jgi:hypothetical protein
MYKTIAAVTNVALVAPGKVQVTRINVRDWCSAAIRVKASISEGKL